MKIVRIVCLCMVINSFCYVLARAQNFSGQIKKQEQQIKQAYKQKRITEKEYYKLLEEQSSIKNALRKYNADGYLTPDEKNKISIKLQKADNRLRKYKTNREVY